MTWSFFKKKNKHDKDTTPEDTVPEQEIDLPLVEKPPDDQWADPAASPEPKPLSSFSDTEKKDSGSDKDSGGFFKRLKSGLSKTRKSLSNGLEKIFIGNRELDEDMLEALEELLITSDIGVQTTMELVARISGRSGEISDVNHLKEILREEALALFTETQPVSKDTGIKPHVVMVVGVNGTGKTTTIGKLAAKFSTEGKKVLVAAADTFRAAAIEQLAIWADRAGADIVKHKQNADPSAVAFDAIDAATARNVDVVIVDTAGRLHTRINLMDELKKIKRTISKRCEGAPHEILLVLDATTGQNALSQAKLFNEAIGITSMVLTKLDGTAKGGIVISICHTFNIPLSYIGVGEKIEDLQEFDPKLFVDALF